MFRRSLVRLAQEARQPSMRFPDRKAVSHGEHVQQPHPAAPQDFTEKFDHFKEVFQSGPHFYPEKVQSQSADASSGSSSTSAQSSKGGGGGKDVAEDIHDLPKRFWQTPALAIEETEMDAIMSGGATLVQGRR